MAAAVAGGLAKHWHCQIYSSNFRPFAPFLIGQDMGTESSYSRRIEKPDMNNANTRVKRDNVNLDVTPPIYYDSEPSAQPPKYPDGQFTSTESRSKAIDQFSAGAPASTIAAVLGSDYVDLDAQRRAGRKKKTIRERWNDFKERNFGAYDISEDRAGAASAAEWNMQGGRIGGGLATPYRRRK